jgi:hypothetical protein
MGVIIGACFRPHSLYNKRPITFFFLLSGGVLCAVILLLVAFWLIRRRRLGGRYPAFLQMPGRPTSPLPIDEEEDTYHRPRFVAQPYLPQSYMTQSYVPEPYQASVPVRTDRSHVTKSWTGDASVSTRDRILSLSSATGDIQSLQTPPSPLSRTQSPPAPPNIIQHEDAGPSDDLSGKVETVEIPPAYSNIRQSQQSPPLLPPVAENE